jgi:hypothetical protein
MNKKATKISSNLKITDAEEIVTRKSLEKDGVTKSIEVKKVVNGYIICVTESGYKDDKWFNNDQIYISTTNPLEESATDEKSFKEEVKKALDNLKLK